MVEDKDKEKAEYQPSSDTFTDLDINFDSIGIKPIEQPVQEGEPVEGSGEEPVEEEKEAQAATEEDTLLLAETLWSTPHLFIERIRSPDEAKVAAWNKQLFLYCQRKGINVMDYFFDELPLIIATATIAIPLYQDWKVKPIVVEKVDVPAADKKLSDYVEKKSKAEDRAFGRTEQ